MTQYSYLFFLSHVHYSIEEVGYNDWGISILLQAIVFITHTLVWRNNPKKSIFIMNKLKAKTTVIIIIGVRSWSYKVPLRLKIC